jgi:hypothetical protein
MQGAYAGTPPQQAASRAAARVLETAEPPAGDLARFRAYLQQHGIRNVVFDMDLTVTAEHSGGVLSKGNPFWLQEYLDSAAITHAVALMRLCRELDIRLGVATFQKEVDDALHVGGTPLVRALLARVGASSLVGEASIVALDQEEYRVMVTNQDVYNKNDMLRRLFAQWGSPFDAQHTLLVDDTLRNVRAFNAIGGHGMAVRGGNGLLLDNVEYMPPPASPREGCGGGGGGRGCGDAAHSAR